MEEVHEEQPHLLLPPEGGVGAGLVGAGLVGVGCGRVGAGPERQFAAPNL